MDKHLILAAALATGVALSGPVMAADSTVRVDANGAGGWSFNASPPFVTGYGFTTEQESIGSGSLVAGPIDSVPQSKFIGGLALGGLVSEMDAVSFDFQLAEGRPVSDATHFYLNVYATLPGSTAFFDCRYDVVPATGSSTSFTTVQHSPDAPTPADTGKAAAASGFACPATMAAMPAGSVVKGITVNMGQSTASDVGVSGYVDNVVVATDSGTTTYDFEASPSTKDDCKDGGFAAYGIFKNQGECVAGFGGGGRA